MLMGWAQTLIWPVVLADLVALMVAAADRESVVIIMGIMAWDQAVAAVPATSDTMNLAMVVVPDSLELDRTEVGWVRKAWVPVVALMAHPH